jgi:hypothetical protein
MATSCIDCLSGTPVDCSDPDACPSVDSDSGSTVVASPTVPSTVGASTSAASDLSQLGNTMGQWGATIAGIVTGTPTVITATGAKTGVAAVPTSSLVAGSSSSMLLLLIAVVVVVLIVAKE